MSEEFFQFHSQEYLWLLLLIPVLFYFDYFRNQHIKLPLSSLKLIQHAKPTLKTKLEFLPSLLKMIAIALIIIALARPQMVNHNTEIKSEGIDIILAIDTSGSMQALDMKLSKDIVDRMTAVKTVVKDFIKARDYDRIGMVVFGEHAYTQVPLTLDHDILIGYLDLIEVGIAGDATAIGNAITTAIKRLNDSKAKSRIVILLTDGESNAGEVSPEIAAEVAREKGIKVYTIGFGSDQELVPFPVKTIFGTRLQKQRLPLDEETLKMIANQTNAHSYRATSTESLKKIYQKIDELEKTKVEIERFTDYDEQYLNYLVPGFFFLVMSWILRQTYFLRAP